MRRIGTKNSEKRSRVFFRSDRRIRSCMWNKKFQKNDLTYTWQHIIDGCDLFLESLLKWIHNISLSHTISQWQAFFSFKIWLEFVMSEHDVCSRFSWQMCVMMCGIFFSSLSLSLSPFTKKISKISFSSLSLSLFQFLVFLNNVVVWEGLSITNDKKRTISTHNVIDNPKNHTSSKRSEQKKKIVVFSSFSLSRNLKLKNGGQCSVCDGQ